MTRNDRIALLNEGRTPLKAMQNHEDYWEVRAFTPKGGWKKLSTVTWFRRQDCNYAIIMLEEIEPSKYIQDR